MSNNDAQIYKEMAAKGMDLMFPTTINGKTDQADTGVLFHITIKLFNPETDDPVKIDEIAKKLELLPPNPEDTTIERGTIKGRNGNTMYVLRLKGPTADRIIGYHQEFKDIGNPMGHEFHPHITIDKALWEEFKGKDGITVKEANIKFSAAELHQGNRILYTYRPKQQDLSPTKQEEAKDMKKSEMEKGMLGRLGTAAAVAGSIATATPSLAPTIAPEQYSRQKMLNAIAQVESSGGQNEAHVPTSHGTAYGKYGLMPDTIKETIRMSPDLKHKYKRAMALQGNDLHHFMQDHPELENVVADRHIARLEHHFGQNPTNIGYGWNQGITGTNRAIKEKKDISSHPYTQKILQNYSKEK